MTAEPLGLPEVLLLSPRLLRDARGHFFESWSADRHASLGVDVAFVQDNVSYSTRGVLRGLHLQHPDDQGKLVTVLRGAIWDVAVDVRRGSPTFGRWVGAKLTADDARQLWIPPGFAHGFVVTGDEALVTYKCTAPYRPASEITVAWDDPALAIEWPLDGAPVLSARDAEAPRLAELSGRLPSYAGAAVGA
ncbi:dTDP-4-dehydrorhamnose 3,5-epimerase [Roseisolibacter sp. H3M3-2]|uniref:dTDP-4-dehydrorhamnose 3,5-epimerase n=1 Tax=Roseisolibacter sp. H3M3-2 TaxID=3031323 RepID=UPI0023DB1AFB|nr:dTDP-4-dehydrorhamnose 3,5-epimerase [Roseisolibacter sp. H3M3-2]MDF1503041.1 dTDP-4-dehydrorhamnose 3,5-epimerase [Roseisolibacter sp. H3M3-2]